MSQMKGKGAMEIGRIALALWKGAAEKEGCDPNVWRKDYRGRTIRFGDDGDLNSKYYWEVECIDKNGDCNDLDNFRLRQGDV